MNHSLKDLTPLAKRLRLSSLLEHAMELDKNPETATLSHSDYLYTLFRDEVARRDEARVKRLVQEACLRYSDACMARIDWDPKRKLNKQLINTLACNDYIRNGQNVIITGPTGCGKTWLADALGQNACVAGFCVKHFRVQQLLTWL